MIIFVTQYKYKKLKEFLNAPIQKNKILKKLLQTKAPWEE